MHESKPPQPQRQRWGTVGLAVLAIAVLLAVPVSAALSLGGDLLSGYTGVDGAAMGGNENPLRFDAPAAEWQLSRDQAFQFAAARVMLQNEEGATVLDDWQPTQFLTRYRFTPYFARGNWFRPGIPLAVAGRHLFHRHVPPPVSPFR